MAEQEFALFTIPFIGMKGIYRPRGGGGQPKEDMSGQGEGGSKLPKKVRTSFMDARYQASPFSRVLAMRDGCFCISLV